jgi:putative copper resistance protein D
LDAWLIAARATHFMACMVLFGEALYAYAIQPGAPLRTRVMNVSVTVAIVSALAWLGIEAVMMSGQPIRQAWGGSVLGIVLRKTQFGHVWLLRMCDALVIALAVSFTARARTPDARRAGLVAAVFVSGLHLVMLAFAGHAGAGDGVRGVAELLVDGVHLFAAGAWLGALPALVALLASAAPADVAVRVTRRFSQVGYAAVAAVVATGVLNAVFRVADVQLLLTTDYGRVLIAKVIIVLIMIALAAVNRFALTPRLADPDRRAALRRNAMLEAALGIVVVVLVGALGVTPPPMDMSPGGHRMMTPM